MATSSPGLSWTTCALSTYSWLTATTTHSLRGCNLCRETRPPLHTTHNSSTPHYKRVHHSLYYASTT